MRKIISLAVGVLIMTATSYALTVPEYPDVSEISRLITRPDGPGNAADYYMKAEEKFTAMRRGRILRHGHTLDSDLVQDPEVEKLILEGLKCKKCEFPFLGDIKIPTISTEIPMFTLYINFAKMCNFNGLKAIENKNFDRAFDLFSQAVNIGLHLLEDPGISFIHKRFALGCVRHGANGLITLFTAKGEEGKALVCKKFLEDDNKFTEDYLSFRRTPWVNACYNYLEYRIRFKLAFWKYAPPRYDPLLKEYVKCFTSLAPSLQVEVLGMMALLNACTKSREAKEQCSKIFEAGKRSDDPRIQKFAERASRMTVEDYIEMAKEIEEQ